MKCKSWSNKINNFVVRRLKSIKINGTQQQLQSPSSAASIAAAVVVSAASSSSSSSSNNSSSSSIEEQQQQQQQLTAAATAAATMPAMPKEKATTAVSLSESNYSLNLKELTVVVVGAMATTAATRLQQQQQQQHSCGHCAATATPATATQAATEAAATNNTENNNNNNNNNRYSNSRSNKYLTNGYTSPLAAAVASNSSSVVSTPQRSAAMCGSDTLFQRRLQLQQQQLQQLEQMQQQQQEQQRATSPPATQQQQQHQQHASQPPAQQQQQQQQMTPPPRRSPVDFIFGRFIGEGSFSMVYLAVDIHNRREYAIKVCEKRLILREHKQDYIKREREVMHMMTNVPGFVNLSCTFQDQRSLYFVMTHARKGDLLPYINRVGSFDAACTRHYAAELLLACEHMHRRNVVHRDLKPENILLDEDMHTLIADFGSAKVMTPRERIEAAALLASTGSDTTSAQQQQQRRRRSARSSDDDDEDSEEFYDDIDDEEASQEQGRFFGQDEEQEEEGGDVTDAASRTSPRNRRGGPSMYPRRRQRHGSFVGTAQYVSPEVLQSGPITPAADLWALGCIIYQMISGLPPFRGSNDYVIFKEILGCAVDFPQGFDKDAEDLVRRLLKIDPRERLGAQDEFGYYQSIRAHPFFDGIDWTTLRQQTPPPIYPYLPGVSQDDELRSGHDSNYSLPISGDLEPGLDERQITRLLSAELGVGSSAAAPARKPSTAKNSFDLSDAQKMQRLEAQKTDKWHVFADGEVILKKGFVNKRKGLFARKRMLLLTTGPRLIYIDPVQMIKKGEIPWSPELRAEVKNFKIFFVHTPNRTYYLDDPDGYAMQWVDAIENMSKLCYGDAAAAAATGAATTSISSCGSSNSLAVQQQSSSNSSSALLNSNSPASNNSSPTARRSSPQQQQRKSDVTTPAASASTSTATATRGLKTASN